MIIADASWIVVLRDPADAHHEAAVDINDELGDERALLAAVTFAECLVAPAKLGKLEVAAAQLRAAFDVVTADPDAPVRWAALRADTGLRLPDAVVVDTAVRHRARAIATFDEKLAACAIERGIGTLGT